METSTSDLISAQVALSKKKSMGIALILVLFFGPLGLFYSSVLGALLLLGLPIGLLILGSVIGSSGESAGGGFVLLALALIIPDWIICMIWAAVAVSGHNRKIERTILRKVA